MNREAVDAWFEGFRSKDISKLRLAEDFVHASPFGEIRGRERYLEMVRENAETFFSRAIEVIDMIDGGDRFAVRYTVGGMEVCEWIHVRDGEIASINAYYHFGEKPVLPELVRWYGD